MLILANLIYLHPSDPKCYEATNLLISYAKFFNIRSNQAQCDLSYEQCLKYNITINETNCKNIVGKYASCCGHVITEYWIGNESYYIDPTTWNNWYSANISIRFKCMNEGVVNWTR